MKKLFSPVYILLFVLLPQLFSIGYLSLTGGVGNMKPLTNIILIMLSLSLIFTSYAIIRRRQEVISLGMCIAISAAYALLIGFILFGGANISSIRSFLSPNIMLVVASIVPLMYGISGIVSRTTPADKPQPTIRYIGGIILIPLLWFFGMNVLIGSTPDTLVMIAAMASIYAFLFFLVKLLFIWKSKAAPLSSDAPPSKKVLLAIFVIAFCMPLGGLMLNQGASIFASGMPSSGLFGDFSSPWFYIIAAVNGSLLLIPPIKHNGLRLLAFFFKSAGYTYILYFFLVFLPIMPFGFIGIVFYGLGLLVLAPAMITLLQGYHLAKEGLLLSKVWNRLLIAAVFCLGIITLPLMVTASFYGDKENLSVAVQYLQSDNFENKQEVDLARLKRTLKNVKGSMDFTTGFFGRSEQTTPFISQYYSKLIMDGKLLPQENVIALENLFFDAGHETIEFNLSDPGLVSHGVRLTDMTAETRFDEKNGVYKSWIHLKLENSIAEGNGEYKASFKLPEGAYISNYYLDVLGERKQGLLTDRRAAMFIYQKIVNTRRDPGLLRYIGDNTLELRVFPFGPNEIRNTGFEVIHSQKLDLSIGSKMVSLDGLDEQQEIQVPGALLLPASQKTGLPKVSREPKYYFVIDGSKNSDLKWQKKKVQEYAQLNNIKTADVVFASYKLNKHTLADMALADYKPDHGFNLNMAVHMILSKENPDFYPVIIAVTDNMNGALLPRDVYALADKFPESKFYYALNHDMTLTPYSYDSNKQGLSVESAIIKPILNYKGIYVLDNDENELIVTNEMPEEFTSTGNQYKDAVLLDAWNQTELLQSRSDSMDMVRASFRAGVLTPQTAFIVVETHAQEKELLELQEQLLSGSMQDAPLVTLDEPSLVSCLLILLLLFVLKLKSRRNLRKSF